MSDEIFDLELFRKGDESFYKKLVENYEQRLYLSAYKILKSKEDAEDALVSTFVAAYRNRTRFNGRSEIYTWLWRICFNLCYHRLKKARQNFFCSLDELLSDGNENAFKSGETRVLDSYATSEESEKNRRLVRSALLRLKKKYFRIIVLREIYDYSYDEISIVLKLPRGTVMSRLARTREKLKKILEDMCPHLSNTL